MTENGKEPKKIKKNTGELWQTTVTPLTHEMVYAAVLKMYPELFTDRSELVKFEGGAIPAVHTRVAVNQ